MEHDFLGGLAAVRRLLTVAGCIAVAGSAAAALVDSAAALTAALAQANPGDEILLRDGVYRGKFTLAQSGRAGQPIVVRAENARRATFDRTLFQLEGNHGVLTDLVFERSQVDQLPPIECEPKAVEAWSQIRTGGWNLHRYE